MIEFTTGDILKADAEALVNTVNCYGVMGRGIALQFKKKFPENFKQYKKVCDAGELSPGIMFFVFATEEIFNPRYVINFPTKNHWKGRSKIEDIDSGLQALVDEVRRLGIRSIAIPPLGCGLGGLKWDEVRPRIELAFESLSDVSVFVDEPGKAPSAAAMTTAKVPRLPGLRRDDWSDAKVLFGRDGSRVTLLDTSTQTDVLHGWIRRTNGTVKIHQGPHGPYSTKLHHA